MIWLAWTLDGSRLFVGAGPTSMHVFQKWGRRGHTGSIETRPSRASTTSSLVGGSGRRLAARRAGRGVLWDVGAAVPGGATAPPAPQGRVYAFKRNASGGYDYQAALTSPESETAGDGFGLAVAVSGTTALIGSAGLGNRAGLVHEFELNPSGSWARLRSFAPQGVGPNEGFGFNIQLNGAQAVITAPGDAGNYGAAYVWRKIEQLAGAAGGAGGATPPARRQLHLAGSDAPDSAGRRSRKPVRSVGRRRWQRDLGQRPARRRRRRRVRVQARQPRVPD